MFLGDDVEEDPDVKDFLRECAWHRWPACVEPRLSMSGKYKQPTVEWGCDYLWATKGAPRFGAGTKCVV